MVKQVKFKVSEFFEDIEHMKRHCEHMEKKVFNRHGWETSESRMWSALSMGIEDNQRVINNIVLREHWHGINDWKETATKEWLESN